MKLLMLTDSNFPDDVRIRQEAYKLIAEGHQVSVIGTRGQEEALFETVNGVKVYRVPKIELFRKGKQSRGQKGKPYHKARVLLMGLLGYGFEFAYFTIAAFIVSFWVLFKDGFDVIHTHNPPDTLFIITSFHKLLGKKFVYDHHDLAPDLFREKYGRRSKVVYSILLLLERLSCRAADIVIATNESYKRIEMERCDIKPDKIYVVRNGPNLDEMKPAEPFHEIKSRAKTVLCYLGAINVQDGVDNLLEVLQRIVFKFGYKDVCLLIVGDGDYLYKIRELADEKGVNGYVVFAGYISERSKICRYLSTADIFVDAAPTSFLNDNSTFIKHMEYMVFGKPVVSFALRESMFSLDGAGVFIEGDSTDEMAKAIVALADDDRRRLEIGMRGPERVTELAWDCVSEPLIKAYEMLAR